MPRHQLPAEAVWVISGAASGIGLALSEAVLARGWNLIAADLDHRKLERVAQEKGWTDDRIRTRMLDVRDSVQWNAVALNAVTTFGRIDVLVNAAGLLEGLPVEADRPDEVHRQIDVNVKGVMFGTAAAAKHMLAAGSGHIINIASLAGVGPIPGMSVYCGSKYAVRGYSLTAALELRPRGVFVTAVCPDSVATPMMERQKANPSSAMMFSGARPLTTDEIVRLILDRVIPSRPYEVRLPFRRGWLARLADGWPALAARLLPGFLKKGRAVQRSR
jgi:3-oxoacyl-[acyl-carrier protein] reductase